MAYIVLWFGGLVAQKTGLLMDAVLVLVAGTQLVTFASFLLLFFVATFLTFSRISEPGDKLCVTTTQL